MPLTVNGGGVREGAHPVLFGMAGLDRSAAIALGLLWFVSTMLGALPRCNRIRGDPAAACSQQ